MSADLQKLIDRITTDLGVKDPEKIALLSRLAVDAASLQARALAGLPVEAEMRVLQATAANLDERSRQVVSTNFATWLQGLLATALGVAVAGA